MRFRIPFSIVFTLLLSSSFAQPSLNVMTFNIRYSTLSDSQNAWPYRKEFAASEILFHQVHVLGVQEALQSQMDDLQARLKAYKHIGVGRDDGKQKGEYSAIFYDTTRLQQLQSSTFWLSEDPTAVGKKGWDAAFPRIVTWAKFRDESTNKIFFVFNTHFDHMGQVARRESAKLLLQKVAAISGNSPAIVMGDFNADPASEPIQVITDKSNPQHLTDSKLVSQTPHYGPTGTFNGFGPKERDDQPIDHIFVKNGVDVLQHATLSQTWGGRFSSDHFPVFARVVIE